MNARSDVGRNWHARRIEESPAPTRCNTCASRPDGRGKARRSLTTRIRHVEQRARPPQTLACGTRWRRLPSRTLSPFGTLTFRSGYVRVTMPRRRLRERADTARHKHQTDKADITDREIEIRDVIKDGALGWRNGGAHGRGATADRRHAGLLPGHRDVRQASRATAAAPREPARNGAAHRKNSFKRSQK